MSSRSFGDQKMGMGNSESSAGSSRRGKKGVPEKPKQPQRGLGVAQLEKIRLQSEMAEYLPPLQPSFLTNLNMEDQVRMPVVLSSSVPSSSVNITTPSSLFAVHPNVTMAYGGDDRRDFPYNGFENSTPAIRPISNPKTTIPSHYYTPQNVTLPLFDQTAEDSIHRKSQYDKSKSIDSVNPNCDYSTIEELDLELKL